jgi:2'-5' RNA ligase
MQMENLKLSCKYEIQRKVKKSAHPHITVARQNEKDKKGSVKLFFKE